MFEAGSIIAKLGLDTTPFATGINKAVGLAEGMGSRIGNVFKQIGIGALRKIGEEITDVVGHIAARIGETMESIDVAGKAANQLGITTERFTGLSYAADLAGVNSQEFAQTLRIMVNNLADAAVGAGNAQGTLKELGLDVKALVDASPDEALFKIADALNAIDNPAQRVQAMMNIFGKQAGPELANLLASGSDGMQKMIDRAKELGVAVTDVDFQKVQAANDALNEAGKVIQGVLNQAVVQLAPYIKGLADEFTKAATAGGGFGRYAIAAVEGVAQAIAAASDYANLFSVAWNALTAIVLSGGLQSIKTIDYIGSSVVQLLNTLPGVKVEWVDTFSVIASSLEGDIKAALDATDEAMQNFVDGKNSKAVTEFFDRIKASAQKGAEEAANGAANMRGAFKGVGDAAREQLKKIEDAMADLQKQIDQFGLSDMEKSILDFASMTGVTDEQLDKFIEKAQKLESLQKDAEKEKEWKDKLDAFKQSIETPLDAFNKQMDFLQEALGRGDITSSQFDLGAAKARKDAFGEDKLPALVKAGSAEAFAAQFDAQKRTEDNPVAIARDQKKLAEKTLAVMKDVRDELRDLNEGGDIWDGVF